MGRHSGLKSKWILADRASQEPFAAVSLQGSLRQLRPDRAPSEKLASLLWASLWGATYQRLLDQIERDR
jgi:hypothetical protein